MINASFLGLSLNFVINFSPFYQVLICGIFILLQFYQFWNMLWTELANENFHKASIGGIKLKLLQLQEPDPKV